MISTQTVHGVADPLIRQPFALPSALAKRDTKQLVISNMDARPCLCYRRFMADRQDLSILRRPAR
jgi:hypothetical protein